MSVRFYVVLTLVLCCSISYAEETVEIPLSDIWAYDMPLTKRVQDLEPDLSGYNLTTEERLEHSHVLHMARILSRLVKRGETVPQGFAVAGIAKEALDSALAVLKGDAERGGVLSDDDDVTVIFYTARTGKYVHLDAVERAGNHITITYHLVFHSTMNLTTHFALIPMGKLLADEYHVNMKRGPSISEDRLYPVRPLKKGEEETLVCGDFQFLVKE